MLNETVIILKLIFPIAGLNILSTGNGSNGYYYYISQNNTPIVFNATINISFDDLDTGTRTTTDVRSYARNLGYDDDDAGHILAHQLGGLAQPINIFPQSPHINRGMYREYEEYIYNCIDNRTIATLNWKFTYPSKKSTRPKYIYYSVKFKGSHCKNQTKRFNNDKVSSY